MNTPDYRRERGFSLVELMVAMVVGLLLLAGVLQILLANREAFDAQRGRGHLQENARLASFMLENVVAHAGFRTDLTGDLEQVFRANDTLGADFRPGAVVSSQSNTQGQSDTLYIRFQGEGSVHNCRGASIGSPGSPETTYVSLFVEQSRTLMCRYVTDDKNPSTAQLVEGVDRFEVRYGLDTDDDNSADRYVSDLTAAQAAQVVSVRIQLLLRTLDEENLLPVAQQPDYVFSDGSDTGDMPADRAGRLFLDQTIALRNTLQ
ncbi:PilW family protein [Endozoicomonas sp. G2_2]|uniref:PilW family protein n=1 Tax=Endozoicomonas sp. G2_2 TaxID=2821092 RepID=UPI001ADAB6FA|nr:PilW family protein [Endozoicomonas sp. G2_2]